MFLTYVATSVHVPSSFLCCAIWCTFKELFSFPFSALPHSVRANNLTSTRQLVGQTVNSEAMATDAIKVDVKYELNVSCA